MTRQELLDFMSGSDGATNNEIAARFSVSPAYAATRTKQLFDTGYTTRVEIARTVSNHPIYKNRVKTSVSPDMTKKERLQAESPVRERLDNGGISGMIQGLADAIAKQIAASVVVSLQESLAREMASVVPQHVPPAKQLTLNLGNLPPEPPVTKPTVGIVGLLPVQEEAISAEFGGVFDLRYWKEGSVAALKALARASELVLVTKWCAHSATETLKSVGVKWRFVDGGLTELKSMLTALCVEN